MLGYILVSILLSSFVATDAQNCYRCFGNNWCNNYADPNFISNVHTVNCPASVNAISYEGINPVIARVLRKLEEASKEVSDGEVLNDSTWGCITATLYEAHENHTIRTCLNNAAIICPVVRNVVFNPDLNDVSPDIAMDCEGCTDSLCNTHTFIEPEEPTTVAPTTASSSTETVTSTSSTSEGTTSSTEGTTSSTASSSTSETTHPASDITTEEPAETTTPNSSGYLVISYVLLIVAMVIDFFML